MNKDDKDPVPQKPGFLKRLFGKNQPAPSSTDQRESLGDTLVPSLPIHEASALSDLSQSEVSPSGVERELQMLETIRPADQERAGNELSVAEIVSAPSAASADPSLVQEPPVVRGSWWQRLKNGLSRSSSAISQGIVDIFTKRKLDAASVEDLEDLLIKADMGVNFAQNIGQTIGRERFDKNIDPQEIRTVLADEIEKVLAPAQQSLIVGDAYKPFVILVVGVNGSGKTTTIGKLSGLFTAAGKKIMLVAGDTFRAAAIEQLRVWGERTGSKVISRVRGSDAASLAFDAIAQAKTENVDIILMDTAGRLQNRTELMAELEKIIRVMKKSDSHAPHAVILVLDATVGQNALSQVEIFGKVAGVTGLVMTKLDGTARGGILVAITEKFKLPIHFIGVGETMDDIEPFNAREFARAIAGLEEEAA